MRYLVALLALGALPVFAQSYPAKAIRVVVAEPTGDHCDVVARGLELYGEIGGVLGGRDDVRIERLIQN